MHDIISSNDKYICLDYKCCRFNKFISILLNSCIFSRYTTITILIYQDSIIWNLSWDKLKLTNIYSRDLLATNGLQQNHFNHRTGTSNGRSSFGFTPIHTIQGTTWALSCSCLLLRLYTILNSPIKRNPLGQTATAAII